METVEMDLMQAQIGSLATEVSRLEAKVAKGGGGGEGGDFAILTVDADKKGLICSNPNADIFNIETFYESGITGYTPIYTGDRLVFRNKNINETLSLSDLYYLDNGVEVPYTGIKNFATFEVLNTMVGTNLQAVDAALLLPSSTEYYLILDLDTGRVIYANESD